MLQINTMKVLRGVTMSILMSAGMAHAAPATYEMDSSHTYPSFEADHMGVSFWRGKFNTTTGKLVYDKVAQSGTVDVTVDVKSVDFGHDKMNEHAMSADFFDVARYPTAVYQGKLSDFVGGVPTRVVGELTLHGVKRPLVLTVNSFKCIPHPMLKRELCGADASASFNRDEFGLDAGKAYGFRMDVALRIQMEAVQLP